MMQALDLYLARTIRFWGGIYVLAVAILIAASLFTLTVSFWRGPFRDMWEALGFVEKAFAGQATLADYWDQYGFSHRPMVSRWLWVADFRWFAGSNHLLLAVSLLMQLAIGVGVWQTLTRDNTLKTAQRMVLMSGVCLCLLNISQVFNLLHTFDVQWFLTVAAVVWSLERLIAGMEDHRSHYLVVAWLCVLFASWNNFSGLVIWPVQLVFLRALGYPSRQIGVYLAVTILYLIFYFSGLPTGTGDVVHSVLKDGGITLLLHFIWMVVVIFPVWYLSNPFSFQFSPEGPLGMGWPLTWLAPLIASVVVIYVLVLAFEIIFRKKPLGKAGWMGLMLAMYGYGVAVVTSLGRGMFWDNVYALRYQNIVLLFWIGIILVLASTFKRRYVGLLLGMLLLMAVIGVHQGWNHNNVLKMGNRTRDAHLALTVGLESQLSAIQATVSRSHLEKDSDYTLNHEAAFLRTIHAGPVADPAWQVPTFDTLKQSAICTSQVAAVDVRGEIDAYARLSLDFTMPVHYPLIAWFDADKAAPGLLIASQSDTFMARIQESINGFTRYAGFAKKLPELKPEHIYARDENNVWCQLHINK
jgi:hypothetical protein